MTPVILASASPRRAEILKKYGISFQQISSGAEEPGSLFAEDAAMCNALVKAEDLAEKYPDRLVIAADTVIEFEGEVIGKPEDPEDAVRILKRLSGKKHFVTTGVCIIHAGRKIKVLFADLSEVAFKAVDDSVIREYISKVNVLDKAGAYALQEHPELIIESVTGDPENVIGLPYRAVEALQNLL